MPETIKAMWLHDKSQNKIAPKTLMSQVQTEDGVLLEDKIQADLDTTKAAIDQLFTDVAYINAEDNENIENPDVVASDITIDSALSTTSTNPIQNRAVAQEFNNFSQQMANKLGANDLSEAINDVLAQAKASGEFNGADGQDGQDGASITVASVSESAEDGGSNVITFSDGKTLTVKNGKTGAKGDTGDAGKNGSDANVTAGNIEAALGYTPADTTEVSQLSTAIGDLNTKFNALDAELSVVIGSGVIV